MTLFESLTVTIMGVGVIIALIQIQIGIRTLKADHERRKKQSTIEYLNNLRTSYRNWNNELIKKFGADPVGTETANKIIEDVESWTILKDMLGLFEHLAVGINTSVFDIDILNKMAGQYLIDVYDRWKVYINERRKDPKRQNVYRDYEILVNRLHSIRKKDDGIGSIRYS